MKQNFAVFLMIIVVSCCGSHAQHKTPLFHYSKVTKTHDKFSTYLRKPKITGISVIALSQTTDRRVPIYLTTS